MSLDQPSAPNPYDLANAQSGYNQQSAQQQQALNQTNQITPYGSLSWAGVGTNNPTAAQSLSPAQQQLLNQYQMTQGAAGGLGATALGNMSSGSFNVQPYNKVNPHPNIPNFSSYATPPDFTSASAPLVQSQMKAFQDYMAPIYGQQQSNLNSQLQSQGIPQGSDAWNNAQRGFLTSQDQAGQSALMNFEPQAFSQAVQTYMQPLQSQSAIEGIYGQNANINALSAQMPQIAAAIQGQNLSNTAGLLGLSAPQGVQQPFINPPQAQIQPPNYQGAAEQQFQQQQQQFQNTMSGLGQVAGMVGNGLFGGAGGMGSSIRGLFGGGGGGSTSTILGPGTSIFA